MMIGMSTMNQFVNLMQGWFANVTQILETYPSFIPPNKGLKHAQQMTSGVLMSGLTDDGSINPGIFSEVRRNEHCI